MLVRVGAVVPLRVDHRERGRQLGVGLVVVGDDQVDAELARAPRRLGAADAAVDRHDQRHAVGVQPLDRRRLQAVAVPQPLRDEVDDVAAEHLERAAQDDRRGDAVDVVVAVDGDPLAPRDRLLEPRRPRPSMSASLNGSCRWSSDGLRKRCGGLGIVEARAGTAAARRSGADRAPPRAPPPGRRRTAGAARPASSFARTVPARRPPASPCRRTPAPSRPMRRNLS